MQIKDRNQIYKIRKKFHKQSRRKYTLNRRNVFVDKNSRKKTASFHRVFHIMFHGVDRCHSRTRCKHRG